MSVPFHKILLAYKKNHAKARELAFEVAKWLADKKLECSILEAGQDLPISDNVDLIVPLGGDGTILGLCRKVAGKNIPVFGINLGRVGFLTGTEANNWQPALTRVLEGRTEIRYCLALVWKLLRKGTVATSGCAINDVVLSRATMARLVSLDVSINGEDLGHFRGDGLIACTPLGSSGYSISAGGSLMHAGMNAMGLTPVCPFLTNVAPLVFEDSAIFKWSVSKLSAACYLTIDGQEGFPLQPDDMVEITGWPGAIQFVADDRQFFSRLRKRGFTLEQ